MNQPAATSQRTPDPDLLQDPPPEDVQSYIQQLKDYIRVLREQNTVLRADLAEFQRREFDTVIQRS